MKQLVFFLFSIGVAFAKRGHSQDLTDSLRNIINDLGWIPFTLTTFFFVLGLATLGGTIFKLVKKGQDRQIKWISIWGRFIAAIFMLGLASAIALFGNTLIGDDDDNYSNFYDKNIKATQNNAKGEGKVIRGDGY